MIANAKRANASDKYAAVTSIPIANQITRELLPATGRRQLVGDPFRRWVRGNTEPQDMIVSERRAPGRIGQTYAIKYNPEHKWYWFPRMRREEAYVFKVFDSMKDGRARLTAHTAFEDPTTPPHARPRESIEIRTMAFF
jgi:hypothetical protein